MRAAAILLLAALVSGCASPAANAPPSPAAPGPGFAFGAPVDALSDIDPPPLPASTPPDFARGDVTLEVDGQGRLYWISLLMGAPVFPQGFLTGPLAGVQVARSDDGGESWAANIHLSLAPFTAAPGSIPGRPALLADGTLVIPSTDPASGVVAIRSADGTTFTSSVVSATPPSHPLTAVVAAPDGLHVTWRGEHEEPLVATSADGGATWSVPRRVHEDALVAAAPALAVENAGVEIAFLSTTQNGSALRVVRDHVAYRPAALGTTAPTTDLAWIAARGDETFAVWTDVHGIVRVTAGRATA